MKESIINNKLLKVIFGFLFIGGIVAVFNIYRGEKNVEHSLTNVMEEYDGDIFV